MKVKARARRNEAQTGSPIVDQNKTWSFSQGVDQMAQRAFDMLELDDGIARAIKGCNAVLQVTLSGGNQGQGRTSA